MKNKIKKSDWRNWLVDILGLQPEDREALIEMLQKLTRQVVTAEEMKMIEGVLEMREWKIRDVMIPLTDVICVKIKDNYQHIIDIVRDAQHSRYPILSDNGDNVLGILLAKDLLGYTDKPDSFSVEQVRRVAVFEPDSKPLDNLLQDFRTSRSHMVIVRDEYGEIAGIVTIEDLLERIVGEIEDESDSDEDRPTVEQPGGSIVIKGRLSIEEFNNRFDSDLSSNGADNIAGWLAAALGHMPKQGDVYQQDNFVFTVIEADSRRVRRILVQQQDD